MKTFIYIAANNCSCPKCGYLTFERVISYDEKKVEDTCITCNEVVRRNYEVTYK